MAGGRLKDAFKGYSAGHCCLSCPCFYYTKCSRCHGQYVLLGIFFVPCTIDFFYSDSWFSLGMVFAQLSGVSPGEKGYGRDSGRFSNRQKIAAAASREELLSSL